MEERSFVSINSNDTQTNYEAADSTNERKKKMMMTTDE